MVCFPLNKWKRSVRTQQSRYLQQLVGQVGLDQPVVQRDVEELILGPLGQTEDLLKLEDDTPSISVGRRGAAKSPAHSISGTHVSCGLLVAEHVGV